MTGTNARTTIEPIWLWCIFATLKKVVQFWLPPEAKPPQSPSADDFYLRKHVFGRWGIFGTKIEPLSNTKLQPVNRSFFANSCDRFSRSLSV
jgi:hypothetical protein